ncbi:MAG: 16S rRNA (cytidine(1402)-2'-O)-methyltransferase [Candidatus Spechtbacteria bacterium]|nr:16S rRNA (cytidine(1402)-2'-O)-methyltransferase [Candidatus Spechtbacteria bacterium]
MGVLYIVATPIGNLEDITLRALRVLKEVDLVLCEDTRVTKKLMDHFAISKPLMSYHQHSRLNKVEEIISRLKQGAVLALVSDAGTPGLSDPGNMLVKEVSLNVSEAAIIPIPGASAVAAIASVAGISMDKFSFMGFPPNKKGRKTFFAKVASSDIPVILYESKYRILKTLDEIVSAFEEKDIVPYFIVGRELTKQFESIYRGTAEDVKNMLTPGHLKGEFVVVISANKHD